MNTQQQPAPSGQDKTAHGRYAPNDDLPAAANNAGAQYCQEWRMHNGYRGIPRFGAIVHVALGAGSRKPEPLWESVSRRLGHGKRIDKKKYSPTS